ncbi:hypothetical protein COHA_007197 [Chlorella ohadii]|uniref:CHRD domain-containing protein n=1 Tax=Chlorella ohadii TaxID=2649997 RepID=A0AAD5DNM6_9CHLO|nr:hypothetical protein COHA_007197 [Chlorella ohadii]
MRTAAVFCLGLALLATAHAAVADGSMAGSGDASLNGGNQVPTPVETTMTAMFTANVTGDAIAWKLEVFDAVNVTMAHIHLGNATTNGPPIVLLAPYGDAAETSTLPEFEEPESGNLVYFGEFSAADVGPPLNGTTLPELLATFMAGDAYVNVHTTAYPAGEIRGQIEWEM